jgi:tetratricopeptide (TPR) repeat protein
MKHQRTAALLTTLILLSFTSLTAQAETLTQVQTMYDQGELEKAQVHIEGLLDKAPDDAKVHYLAGLIYGEQAQNAGMFSAAGLARKVRSSFERAVALDPDNVEYRYALMSFYFFAPAIIGGDDKLGSEQVEAIQHLDAAYGYLAEAQLLQNEKSSKELKQHYDSAPDDVLKLNDFLFARGSYYQENQRYGDAIQDFKTLSEREPEDAKDNSRYHALYQIGRTGVISEQFLDQAESAFSQFLSERPEKNSFQDLPSKAWATFRYAQIKLLKGQKDAAIAHYQEAKKLSTEKDLDKAMKKVRRNFKN